MVTGRLVTAGCHDNTRFLDIPQFTGQKYGRLLVIFAL